MTLDTDRQARIIRTLVRLADTLTDDYDVVDFLGMLAQRCVELVGIDEAGIMLVDAHGALQAVASSSERTRMLELFELQNQDGPCLDAFQTGEPSSSEDLQTEDARWPTFARQARAVGFRAVFSWPLRLRGEVIGAMNLLQVRTGALDVVSADIARALADIATIGLLHERAITETRTTAAQLQTALSGRVLIEQAKGVVAERYGMEVDQAFAMLRSYARSRGARLTEVARAVVQEALDVQRPD